MRTTIDIDAPILGELKSLAEKEGKTLGRLASELLGRTLAEQRRRAPPAPAFRWTSRRMRARLDLGDRDAVYDALDRRAP